jgi:uncharacterized protein (TIGR03083 family)
VRQGFAEQCDVFLDLVEETEDLSVSTALGDWDCAALVGHVSTAIEALFRWQGSPADSDDEVTVVGWLGFGDDEGSKINADFSVRYAAKRSHQQLRDLIVAAVSKGHETVANTTAEAALIPPLPGVWLRFDQALASRVFELTVHGIDLAAAIGSASQPSPVALGVTGAILDELLNGGRPNDLSDDLAWVSAASGRVDHGDPRLPVMR